MNNNYELLETFSKNNEIRSYLRHKKTGLEIAFHKCETDETGFSFNFKTPVEDQYLGTSHVLEHCVMQGSKKYSVCFLELLKLSCYSKFNATTDLFDTKYYFYSPLEDECLKMIPIMADYVFFPELSEEAFMEECIRVEFDPSGDLRKKKISGVVYNEMKAIFPNSSVDGGAWYKLCELTNEKIKEYHEKYYSPDNCLFVFNGNVSLETVLKSLDPLVSELEEKFKTKETAPRKNITVKEFVEKAHNNDFTEEPLPPKKTIPKIISEYLGQFSPHEYKAKLERLHKWQARDIREKMLEIMKPLAVAEYDVELPNAEKDLQKYFDDRKDIIKWHFEKFREVETNITDQSCCLCFRPSVPLTKEFYAEYSLCIFLQGFLSTKLRQKGCLYDLHAVFDAPSAFQIFTLRDRNPEETLELMKKELIEIADYDFSETDLLMIKSGIFSNLFSKDTRSYFSDKIFEVTKEELHKAAQRFSKLCKSLE